MESDKPLHRKNERSESYANNEGQEPIQRIANNRFREEPVERNHDCAAARISRPFSNPYCSKASFRFLLS
jgi:hypothetical protein